MQNSVEILLKPQYDYDWKSDIERESAKWGTGRNKFKPTGYIKECLAWKNMLVLFYKAST